MSEQRNSHRSRSSRHDRQLNKYSGQHVEESRPRLAEAESSNHVHQQHATGLKKTDHRRPGKVSTHAIRGQDSNRTTDGDPFVSDRQGDPGIIQYGSNHSYQVPPYRRIGYGLILGLSKAFKIDREKSTLKEIYLISSNPTNLRRNKNAFKKVAQEQEFEVRPVEDDQDDDLSKDFLRFSQRKLRRHADSEHLTDSSDSDSIDYRSIEGKSTVNHNIDKDLRLVQPENLHQLSQNLQPDLTWQRRVELDPSDGNAWLEYIERFTNNSAIGQTYAERVSSSDVKISIYEKALKTVKGPIRENLLRGLLNEASLVWDEAKLRKKWTHILQENCMSFGLQTDYLNYLQTRPSRFRFDDVKTAYQESFAILKSVLQDPQSSTCSSRYSTTQSLIYTLLRYTIFLRQAGYGEQSIALWQAILESHCAKSDSDTQTTENSFENFWDSEVPRIGEKGARGWKYFIENGGSSTTEQEDPLRPATPDFGSWLDFERRMQSSLPARSMDTTDEEDAFAVVFFSDIQPFLIKISTEFSELVLNAFLLFCGLPPFGREEDPGRTNDAFIHPIVSLGHHDPETNSGEGQEHSELPVLGSSKTLDVLFAKPGSLFSCFQPSQGVAVDLGWVRNALKSCIEWSMSTVKSELINYYLAFELFYFPREARKTSKNLLKSRPQDLRLYNTHALIEYRLGNIDAAEKVLQTAMQMRPNDELDIILKRTLTWESLEQRDPTAALRRLLPGSTSQDAAVVFQAQQHLLAGRDKMMADKSKPSLALAYIDCLMLLSYLTNPEPFEAALVIFASNANIVSTKLQSTDLEILHQSLARLSYHHMSNKPYRPSSLRNALQQSIKTFPTNGIFLSLFRLNEQRSRIDDRVRSVIGEILYGDHTRKDSSLITHQFAIQTEVARSVQLGSGSSAIRSAFERALTDPSTSHAPMLWKWYIDFEQSRSQSMAITGESVRSVIFRAIAACPWVKDFQLLAMKHLNEAGRYSESQSVYEMMVEKEIRLHMSFADHKV